MRYKEPLVQNNPKGSQFLWRDVIADANSTGLLDIQLNSQVESLQWRSGWEAMLTNGRRVSGYEDIILATIPAYECAKIMQNPWKKLVLGQIDYVTTFLTLHTDADATVAKPHFAPAQNSSVLYYVDDETMTGKIGQIFGKSDSDLLLTVHADQEVIRSEKVKTQYAWTHHFFSLWELAISRRFVPMFDADHGLYFAGDWMQGVGHDDAIKAGVAAACKAGIRAELPEGHAARQLYRNLLLDICLDSAPLAESERNPKSR
ncbi:Methyltransferase-like protein 24 [Durusdinium trenchii]|uniref:Methyltransferase-like protein 24 n=2 Tax=Durusdinium trenchii TaxID=1381693 RepID=A0ABP0PBD2_9DINO